MIFSAKVYDVIEFVTFANVYELSLIFRYPIFSLDLLSYNIHNHGSQIVFVRSRNCPPSHFMWGGKSFTLWLYFASSVYLSVYTH